MSFSWLPSLEEAVDQEAEAALALSRNLRESRADALGSKDARRLVSGLSESRDLAEELSRRGSTRLRLTAQAARAMRLAPESTLASIALALKGDGAQLAFSADRLAGSLRDLAGETAAFGISCRYVSAVAGHLASLGRERNGYGPDGCGKRQGLAPGLAV